MEGISARTIKISGFVLLITLITGLVGVTAQGQVPVTVTFQDGLSAYSGCRDTQISGGDFNGYNYGATAYMHCSGSPWAGAMEETLICWTDIFGDGEGQIPPSSASCTIRSATMKLYAYECFKSASSSYIAFRYMLTDWIGGDGYIEVKEGQTCGEARYYRGDSDYPSYPGDAWGSDGLARPVDHNGPVLDVDFTNVGWSVCSIPTPTDPPQDPCDPGVRFGAWMEFDVKHMVQAWRDGTYDNYGLYGYTNGSSQWAHFYSSDYADDPNLRPILEIEYIANYDPCSYVAGPNEIVFQNGLNGYAGTDDSYVDGTDGSRVDNNYGGAETLPAHGRSHCGMPQQALVQFNGIIGDGEDQIPADPGPGKMVVIQDARLRMYAYVTEPTESSASQWQVIACPMYTAWVEGSSDGLAEAGASSLSARQYRLDGDYGNHPEDCWGVAGPVPDPNGPIDGIDYDRQDALAAACEYDAIGSTSDFGQIFYLMEFDVTGAVQAWASGELANNGLHLDGFSCYEGASFYSSEYAGQPQVRPMLVVTYDIMNTTSRHIALFKQGFDGYQGCEDLELVDAWGEGGLGIGPWYYNFGAAATCAWGGVPSAVSQAQASLIKFSGIFGADPGQVPHEAEVFSATLRTYVNDAYRGAWDPCRPWLPGSWINLYPMETSWTEGSANGWAEEAASCHSVRYYHYDSNWLCDANDCDPNHERYSCDPNYYFVEHPERAWGDDGLYHKGPVVGVDYDVLGNHDSSESMRVQSQIQPASGDPCDPNGAEGWIEFDVTEIVEAWRCGVARVLPNYGFYGYADGPDEYARWYSSESAELLRRPELVIEYKPLACGDAATPYPAGDLSGPNDVRDCYVNQYDAVAMAQQWLQCTAPNQQGCDQLSRDYTVDHGMVSVDGNLAEWDTATWIDLDQMYHGEPCDVGRDGAKFALQWNADSDKVYFAITVEDGNHVLQDDPNDWDMADCVEVYFQGDPNGNGGWQWAWGAMNEHTGVHGMCDKAQHYVVGIKPDLVDHWAYLGSPIGGAIHPDLQFEAAVSVDGDSLIYECGVKSFVWFGGHSGAATEPQELVAGMDQGIDVTIGTRHNAGFGMLSENVLTGKWQFASRFASYRLVDASCGQWGFLGADMDRNCRVDLADFGLFAGKWLSCTDPQNPTDCDQ